ncbi:TerS protein [Burkholderia ubonensis]|nr:TerS protein [Burkholderia ubonensis]KVU18562.1 TerS protein [Burkholderia ubonensis]
MRTRSDSTTTAVAATQAAASGPMKPPDHIKLRDADWPYWDAIVQARAATTWNNADLALAANLARTQADISRLSLELEDEGDVMVNARGTPVVNPKHNLLETLTRRAVALSRALHVHAEATVGRSQDAGKKLGAEQAARGAIHNASQADDGLIPGLTH